MNESRADKPWFCYLLQCHDDSFYVGITNDLEERLREHARGKDSEYTAKRRPVRLVWKERSSSRKEARRREVEIKGWSRRKKLELVRENPLASPQGKGA
ncbi:MAG: GIY-YIG nuclease family protein [Terriglobia bacterium]